MMIARQNGFTLIEIMAVVLIIGLLSTIVGVSIFAQVDKGRITATSVQIANLESVLELYRMDCARYPTSEQGLDALVNKPSDQELKHWRKGGYIKKLNKDPWGNPYLYQIPGANGEFDIYSLGADSTVGGTENAADIGNWNLDS